MGNNMFLNHHMSGCIVVFIMKIKEAPDYRAALSS